MEAFPAEIACDKKCHRFGVSRPALEARQGQHQVVEDHRPTRERAQQEKKMSDSYKINEEVLGRLMNAKKKILGCVMLSSANFRRDSCIIDLKDGVNEVFTALKVRGDCVIEWMSYLQETDTISSLLRAESIAR